MALSLPRLLPLRAGEGGLFFRAFALFALTISAHTLLETARDALFLMRLPAAFLTLVYVAVAVASLALTPLSMALVRAVGARNAQAASLVLCAYGSAWFGLQPPSPSLVFALYVFGSLSATIVVAQFWILASRLFTVAQGRRLFGPLAAGGVLGAVFGAAVGSLALLQFEVQSLLTIAAGGYIAAAFTATTIEIDEPAPQGPVQRQASSWLAALREEPFVLELAAIAAAATALSVVVDYVFKAKVSAALDPAELGPFFAHYLLGVNVVSLVLQVLATGPLVNRLGVVGLGVLAPASLLMASLLTGLSGAALSAVAVLKACDAVLKNSVGRVSSELLWAPVANQPRARGLVDGVVTRAAQALTALVLLWLAFAERPALPSLALAASALALGWLLLSTRLKRPYIELFRKALPRGVLERQLTLPDVDVTAAETLLEALSRPDPRDVIAAMDLLAERNRTRLIPALILYHDNEQVLQRALEHFCKDQRKDWLSLGERLLAHPSERVRLAAIHALAQAGARDALERAARHEQATVSLPAALHLAQLDGRPLETDDRIAELLSSRSELSRDLRLGLIEAIATHPTEASPATLLRLAQDPELASAVTRALGRAGDASATVFLMGRLAARDDRMAARAALVRLGHPAFEALRTTLDDPKTPRNVALHVPRTLAAFATPEAITVLGAVLRSNHHGLVRYKALRGLEQLARQTTLWIDFKFIAAELTKNCLEYLRLFALAVPLRADARTRQRTSLGLVLALVEDKLRQSLDRIMRLVQIAQRTEDIVGVFLGLRSEDRHERARAAEFLHTLVRSWESSLQTTGILRLVVDDLSPEERTRAAAPLIGIVPDTQDALARLAEDADPVLSELAQHAQGVQPRLRVEEPPLTASGPEGSP